MALGDASISRNKPVLNCSLLNLLIAQEGQVLGRAYVGHVLAVSLSKDQINLLQGAPGSLRIEEPDDGEKAGIDASEEKISAPSDVPDHDGSDHDDEEVEQPVCAGGDGVSLCTGLDRRDLGRV